MIKLEVSIIAGAIILGIILFCIIFPVVMTSIANNNGSDDELIALSTFGVIF